jgi:hypothetical protein
MMSVADTVDDKLPNIESKNSLKGVFIAGTIIILFVSCWYHALFRVDLTQTTWWNIIGTFHLLEFLYTGLFITCHDAMHGAICHRVCTNILNKTNTKRYSHSCSIVMLTHTIFVVTYRVQLTCVLLIIVD